MKQAANPSTSLDRGLALLSAIIARRGPTTLSVLAETADLSAATRHRLVASLLRAGLVSRVDRGCYEPSAALVRSVAHLDPREQTARVARPVLRRLVRENRLTAHLGILENEMVTYLVKVRGSAAMGGAGFTREGGQLEAYCSAIGKVLLAHAPSAVRADYLTGAPFVALTDRTVTDPAVLAQELDRVAVRGYAVDDREIASDLFCVAVPVTSGDGCVHAALSVSATRPFDGMALQDAVARLRVAAQEITARSG